MQPTNIQIVRERLNFKHNYPIVSNIAYTFQYVEYLNNKIVREHNTSVIQKLLIKDYIINSISILEAVFYLVLAGDIYFKRPVSFNYIFKKIIKENVLGLDKEDISLLYNLKKLRNKVHIYSSYQARMTDYNSFNKKDFLLMQQILYKILNNNFVSNGKFKIRF